MARKTENDQFYIMASTNAHIGEALETASLEPQNRGISVTPPSQALRSLVARFGNTLRKYFLFVFRKWKNKL